MLRPKLVVWLVLALSAAWLASCSSDVDGFHVETIDSAIQFETGGSAGTDTGAAPGIGARGQEQKTGGGPGSGGGPLDASADGPSSGGGSPSGGAGGGATGGVPNTGGSGGGNAGGIPSTGGAPAGGGGRVPTGGVPGSGGASGGGAGGVPTGGVPTGGVPPTGGTAGATGGSPTGGTAGTGGATGGAPGSGGTGGYPGNPTQVTLGPTIPNGITAAAWEPASKKFYLLGAGARQYFSVTTGGTVSAGTTLPGTAAVATNAFGVSASALFFVVGTTLYRQPLPSGTALTIPLPGSPTSTALSGAYAGGWFFIGDAGGAAAALQDAQVTLDANAAKLSGVNVVTTDTVSFAVRSVGSGNIAALSRINPGTFVLSAGPCSAGNLSDIDKPVSVHGNNVAWVMSRPIGGTQYELNVATIVANGACGGASTADFGIATGSSQAVGLIDDTHALVTSAVSGSVVTVALLQASNPGFSRATVDVNVGSGFPRSFVVGVESGTGTTHYAVMVTNDTPVLLSF